MTENYYLDTETWLDIYEKRGNHGELAKRLMEKIIKEGSVILYSDFTVREFKNLSYLNNEIHEILRVAKPNNLKRVHRTKEQIIESIKLAKRSTGRRCNPRNIVKRSWRTINIQRFTLFKA